MNEPTDKQESSANATVTHDSAVIPRWQLFQDGRQPPSWILSTGNSVFDPPTPKTLA